MMGFCLLLFILASIIQVPLILLKVSGVLPLPWSLILAPFWVPNAATALALVSLMIFEDYRSWNPHK